MSYRVPVHPSSPPPPRAMSPPPHSIHSSGPASGKLSKPLQRGFLLVVALFVTAVVGLLSSTQHLLSGNTSAAAAASTVAATAAALDNPIRHHVEAAPLAESVHAADERLLRMLVEECSKGEDTVIWVDQQQNMVVQQAVDQKQPCPAMDIMLRGTERGIGMCSDAILYVMHAGARLIPFQHNKTAYDALCPNNARLFLETMHEAFISNQPGVLHVMLPNSEHMWAEEAHLHAKMHVFLCKTHFCERTLRQHIWRMGYHAQVWFMGHTSSDPSIDTVGERSKSLSFLHIKGKSGLKHTKQLLECWRLRPDLPKLTVVGRFSWSEAKDSIDAPNIVFYPRVTSNFTTNQTELISFQQVRRFQLEHPVHICPSEREGFGHYLNEARAAGALIISTNHPPMNELVTERIGLLIQPERTESYKEMALGRYHPINAFMGPRHICGMVDRVVKIPLQEIERRGQLAREAYEYEKAMWVARMQDLRSFLQQRQQAAVVQQGHLQQRRQQQPQTSLRGGSMMAIMAAGPQAD